MAMLIHHHHDTNNSKVPGALQILNPVEYLRHVLPLFFILPFFFILYFIGKKTEAREFIHLAQGHIANK